MTQNTKQAKNYFGFLNDTSGSMNSLRNAAVNDYNANIAAVKNAATDNMQDTIVSMFNFGGYVTKEVVNSNPHVLKPITNWQASGGTPMRSAIMDMVNMFKSLPDVNEPNVSFVIFATTDGEANFSDNYTIAEVATEIAALSRTGRWTFVFRVPRGGRRHLKGYGIPEGNIQEWDTTEAGMAESTAATTQAVNQFYATRATGKTSSTVFYADASAVDTSALVDITSKVSLYVVPTEYNGRQIRDFILTKRMKYLKGAAFYQLTKTEAKVSHTKLILVRVRSGKDAGKIFAGKDARKMIGMPVDSNARLHPGDHGNYDIFIQSESINRHLVALTGVVYWEEKGVDFTQAELDKFNGNAPKMVAPAVVTLPAVPVSTKPTPSPLKPVPKAPVAPVMPMFITRSEARNYARKNGFSLVDRGAGYLTRWTVK